MPRPRRLHPVAQLAIDETIVESPDIEAALERRQRAADDAAEVRGVYRKADDEVKGLLEHEEFADDQVVRIGRFRISRTVVAPKHVEFDSKGSNRLSIKLVDEA